jgi:hypothetical protein
MLRRSAMVAVSALAGLAFEGSASAEGQPVTRSTSRTLLHPPSSRACQIRFVPIGGDLPFRARRRFVVSSCTGSGQSLAQDINTCNRLR